MGHVSLCFDVDNVSCEATNIIKEITKVISVDNNKKISTCLYFGSIRKIRNVNIA